MNRNTEGFSLAEIVVATGLLVTLLIPVLVFNQRGVVEAGVTQEELVGRQILMDLCERYKAASPEELEELARDPSKIDRDDLLVPLRTAAHGTPFRFARAVEIKRNLDGVVGLHGVTFVVAWTSRHRPAQRATLQRLIHWH